MRYRILHYTGVVYDAIATIDEKTFNKYKHIASRVHGNKHAKSIIFTDISMYEHIREYYRDNR